MSFEARVGLKLFMRLMRPRAFSIMPMRAIEPGRYPAVDFQFAHMPADAAHLLGVTQLGNDYRVGGGDNDREALVSMPEPTALMRANFSSRRNQGCEVQRDACAAPGFDIQRDAIFEVEADAIGTKPRVPCQSFVFCRRGHRGHSAAPGESLFHRLSISNPGVLETGRDVSHGKRWCGPLAANVL